MQTAYRHEVSNQSRCHEWFNRFKAGLISLMPAKCSKMNSSTKSNNKLFLLSWRFETVTWTFSKEEIVTLRSDEWVLHRDNAPVHSAFVIHDFRIKKYMTVLLGPPYSPDLDSTHFFILQAYGIKICHNCGDNTILEGTIEDNTSIVCMLPAVEAPLGKVCY